MGDITFMLIPSLLLLKEHNKPRTWSTSNLLSHYANERVSVLLNRNTRYAQVFVFSSDWLWTLLCQNYITNP